MLLSTSAFSSSVDKRLPFLLIGGGTLSVTFLFWLTYLQKPFLLFLAFLAKFSSSCALALLTSSLHNWAASLYSSQDTCPCFHCLCSSLLPFSLTSKSRLSHDGLLPSLHDFLHPGTKSSCALWKASLKICQLCSTALSLRTVSQGVLMTNSCLSQNLGS